MAYVLYMICMSVAVYVLHVVHMSKYGVGVCILCGIEECGGGCECVCVCDMCAGSAGKHLCRQACP